MLDVLDLQRYTNYHRSAEDLGSRFDVRQYYSIISYSDRPLRLAMSLGNISRDSKGVRIKRMLIENLIPESVLSCWKKRLSISRLQQLLVIVPEYGSSCGSRIKVVYLIKAFLSIKLIIIITRSRLVYYNSLYPDIIATLLLNIYRIARLYQHTILSIYLL